MEIIASILLLIDGVIYNAIKYIYNIFNFMAGVNIFNDAAYQDITAKIYTILGLIMMFVLAYTLLKAVMNPDDFAKGEKSFPNIIKNVIISLVLIVVMPAIFSFAMDFQASILNNNTIYKFVLGRENLEEETVNIGSQVAYYTFTSFFYPSEEFCTDGSGNMTSEQATACKSEIKSNGSTWYRPSTWFSNDVVTLAEVDSLVESGQASFTNYNDFSEAVADNEISYSMIISTVAGVFVLYVLLNFCFDIAVRVIKLAFYQLIAPIPIICRILPGGNMKGVFDKWTKQTISVYVEVFIRIATMALGVYLITLVIDAFNTGIPNIDSLGFVARMIVRALLIMAVIIFIRQAPKLIGDIFHLDTGGMKLGIMDKLAMGGALTAGAAVGGGITSLTRNSISGFKKMGTNAKNAEGFKGKAGAIIGGTLGAFGSGIAGGVSATVRSGKTGFQAKNFKDMKGAASKGIAGATSAKNQRQANKERYKAQGGNIFTRSSVGGHVVDFGQTVKEWATGGASQYEGRIKQGNTYTQLGDALKASADKIISKNGTDTALVRDMNTSLWKGTGAVQSELQTYYDKLISQNGGKKFSLDQLDSYISQISSVKIEKKDFGGDEDKYRQALMQQAHEVEVLNNMKTQLHKQAQNLIINNAVQGIGIGDISQDKLVDVVSDFRNLQTQYQLDGSNVTDNLTNDKYEGLDLSKDVAEQVNNIVDAFGHNASIAREQAAKYEKAKAARSSDGGNK